MRKITFITLAISILSFLTSSVHCLGATKNNIHSKTWSLVEISGEEIAPKDGKFTLSFEKNDNKFSGMAECNRYFGRFNTQKKKLSFEYVNSTRMMCPDQEFENKYIKLINKVDSYSLRGNTLKLKSDRKVILVYNIVPERPMVCALPVTIDAHSWSVTDIGGEKFAPENESLTITFDKAESKFYGMGDCNRFFGIYSTSDKSSSITLGNIGSTQMFCPNQASEDTFLIALGQIDSYQIEGNILQLISKGKVQITFKAIPKIQGEK